MKLGCFLANPVPNYKITTAYKVQGEHWRIGYHTGIDYKAPTGTIVVAAQDCRVIEVSQRVSWGESYGTAVIVLHRDMTRAIYAHLSKANVIQGQELLAGDRIGRVGNTGNSTGSHLHFEVRTGKNVDGSGYKYGDDVDPLPYVSNQEISLGLKPLKEQDGKPTKSTKRRATGGGRSK